MDNSTDLRAGGILGGRMAPGLMGAAALCLALGVGPERLGAQGQPEIITGGPTCQECSIERHLLVTLHDTTYEGGAIGDGGAKPHVNSDGTFLAIAGPSPFETELYFAGPDGALASRVGRSGEGPGEFKRPTYVMESDSDFIIGDTRLARMTYLRKPTLEFVRTSRIPGSITGSGPIAFRDGSYVMWGSVGTREAAGYGAHHVSPTGKILRSFCPRTVGKTASLAASGDTAVWLGFEDYRLQLWSLQGELLKDIQRKADWVKPREGRETVGEAYTRLSGLHQDAAGRLWVITVERPFRDLPSRPGEWRNTDNSGSVIEVLDPSSLTVIASKREMGREELSIPSRALVTGESRRGDGGFVFTDVWGFRLVGPGFE